MLQNKEFWIGKAIYRLTTSWIEILGTEMGNFDGKNKVPMSNFQMMNVFNSNIQNIKPMRFILFSLNF